MDGNFGGSGVEPQAVQIKKPYNKKGISIDILIFLKIKSRILMFNKI